MIFRWSKKDRCTAWGRNGMMWIRGIAISDPADRPNHDNLRIYAINSRGFSTSIRLDIPMRAVPELIKVLQEVMLRRDEPLEDVQLPEIKSTP